MRPTRYMAIAAATSNSAHFIRTIVRPTLSSEILIGRHELDEEPRQVGAGHADHEDEKHVPARRARLDSAQEQRVFRWRRRSRCGHEIQNCRRHRTRHHRLRIVLARLHHSPCSLACGEPAHCQPPTGEHNTDPESNERNRVPAGRRPASGLSPRPIFWSRLAAVACSWPLAPENRLCSRAEKCKSEEWFLVETKQAEMPPLYVRFDCQRRDAERRIVEFGRTPGHPHGSRYAWVQAPTDATRVALKLPRMRPLFPARAWRLSRTRSLLTERVRLPPRRRIEIGPRLPKERPRTSLQTNS